MATFTWNTGSGSFATAGNWTPSGPPGAADTAVFNAGSGTISGSGTVATLQLSGTWTWAGPLSADNYNVSGTQALSTGGVWTLIGTPSNNNYLVIGGGSGGSGSLTVSGGGSIASSQSASTSARSLYVASGTSSNSTGSLTITGSGSSVNTGQNGASIGQAGNGTLTVQAGGSATFGTTDSSVEAALAVARNSGSAGTVTVSGSGSTLTVNGFAYFGRGGQATLTVTSGGTLTAGSVASGSTPAYGIELGGSSAAGSSPPYFGGSSTATVSAGGTLDSLGNIDAGFSGTTGSLTVTGSGSLAEAGGQIVIGGGMVQPGGKGTLLVQAGGTVRSGSPGTGNAGIAIGLGMSGTTGTATVTGSGSLLDANGYRLTVSGTGTGGTSGGTGSLTISNGGVARAGSSYTDTEAALAVGAVAGGTGTITITGTGSALMATGIAVLGGNEKNATLAQGGTGVVTVASGGTLQVSGGIVIQGGSSLSVDGSSTLTTPAITLNGGTATLAALTTATAISFQSTGTLAVGAVTGSNTVAGFTYGDVLDFTGGASPTLTGSTVTVGSGSVALAAAPSGSSYQLVADGHGGTDVVLSPQSIGIYRFLEANGTHFYTNSLSEAQGLATPGSGSYRGDFTPEVNGFGAYAQVANDPVQEQVFRFLETTNGTEFLTASAQEAAGLMDPTAATYRPDLVEENASTFFEDSTQQPGDVAVFRFFNTVDGTHFYTASQAEFTALTTPGSSIYQANLTPEGVAFYAPSGTYGPAT